MKKGKQGFANMNAEKRKIIASLGGKAAHKNRNGKRAHEWTSEEARAAGKKGGTNRAHARKLNEKV